MAEVIVFPDIEDTIREYLDPLLSGTDIYAGVTPKDLADMSVTIVRTGGPQRDLVIDEPTVSIDCRAASTPSAALAIAQLVRGYMATAARTGWIGDVPCYQAIEQTGPYLNPDPVNPSHHRYTVAFALTVRGHALP